MALVHCCAKQAQSSNFSGSVPCCFDVGTLEQHVRCLSPSGLLLSCSCSTSLDSAFLQRRAPLLIIETQKSPWNVSDRFVSRKNNGVTVWIMKFLFFSAFPLPNKCFPPVKCLPWTASSASAPRRRSVWMPPRSTTCGPSAPPSPCLLV